MRFTKTGQRRVALVALAAATTLFAAGCSAGSLGSSSGEGSAGATTITLLTGAEDADVASAKAVIEAFTAANPNITIKHDTRPGGSEGDNLVKTRLATGDMAEVFIYNNGSLLQAIKPEQNLTPPGRPAVGGPARPDLRRFEQGLRRQALRRSVRDGVRRRGALQHPGLQETQPPGTQDWDEFMKNNEAIKKAGIDPVEQTYGTTWTSQLFVLGDYHNVEAQVPDFAAKYTAGELKYATTPAALAGFQHIQDVKDAGYFNKDFASAKLNDGIKAVATGTAAHYPQLGGSANNIENVAPGKSSDVGFFALPGPDAATNGMTVWPGTAAMYIPKSVEGDKLEAAKKLIAFAATQQGCDAYSKGSPPQGPYLSNACKLPAEVSQVAKDTTAYFDSGKASPALEFKSPIKGPALEQICIQVGTGQVDAKKGAELYDQDVKKQAQQLGLPGWE
jgi:raffinose/stachyose/melibiose transport system substrate-binding protein